MSHVLILWGFRPAHLVAVGVALVVLAVVCGQVLDLVRHNRAARTRRHAAVQRDDAEPWADAWLPSGRAA